MWKQMLLTDQLEIQMDESNQLLELKLNNSDREKTTAVRLTHAELIQLMHTLLEVNRRFRGDVSFFKSDQVQIEP